MWKASRWQKRIEQEKGHSFHDFRRPFLPFVLWCLFPFTHGFTQTMDASYVMFSRFARGLFITKRWNVFHEGFLFFVHVHPWPFAFFSFFPMGLFLFYFSFIFRSAQLLPRYGFWLLASFPTLVIAFHTLLSLSYFFICHSLFYFAARALKAWVLFSCPPRCLPLSFSSRFSSTCFAYKLPMSNDVFGAYFFFLSIRIWNALEIMAWGLKSPTTVYEIAEQVLQASFLLTSFWAQRFPACVPISFSLLCSSISLFPLFLASLLCVYLKFIKASCDRSKGLQKRERNAVCFFPVSRLLLYGNAVCMFASFALFPTLPFLSFVSATFSVLFLYFTIFKKACWIQGAEYGLTDNRMQYTVLIFLSLFLTDLEFDTSYDLPLINAPGRFLPVNKQSRSTFMHHHNEVTR